MAFMDLIKNTLGMGEDDNTDTADRTFDDVKGDIEFSGFSDDQKDVILGQLEQVWATESGRDMIEDGLAKDGLHYLNVNEQSVIADVAPRIARSPDEVAGIGNFALPASGEVYLNGYPGLDADGTLQTYSGLHPNIDGQTADAKTPITSLDVDGTVFSVPPIYTMIHETNHAARGEPDLPRFRPSDIDYDAGMPLGTPEQVAAAYAGPNEVSTREILTEMGIDQQRGSYGATGLEGSAPGDAYGLGRDHDLSVTPSGEINATGHAAADIVAVDAINQATLDSFGASDRTSLLDTTFRMGNADDTVHALDGNDTVHTGDGVDAVYLGTGDDTAIARRGAKVIDGGAANLDPDSDHRSDATTDWGFDTVDYTNLPVAFAPPQIEGGEVDGVLLSVGTDAIWVNKGRAFAPQGADDIDALNNIDRVTGTDRDDVAEITGFANGTVLDGAGGTDLLSFDTMPDGELTHVPGAGEFNGVAYDGQVLHGDSRLYYRGYESIDLPGATAATIETSPEPDVEPGAEPSASTGVEPGATASAGADGCVPVTLVDAAKTLRDTCDDAIHDAHDSHDHSDHAAAGMLSGGGAEAMLMALHRDGRIHIHVHHEAMSGDPLTRARGVLEGASREIRENGLEKEAASIHEDIKAERSDGRDASAGTEASADKEPVEPYRSSHDELEHSMF